MHGLEQGTQVCLYLDRVNEGYARKLAHMWHGPFGMKEMCKKYAARLEFSGTPYNLYPVVHVSKLNRVRLFPDRPRNLLTVEQIDRLDFDEPMLPEDSWEGMLEEDEFQVKKIVDI